MVEQGREGCMQEQDCLQCYFQVIISNSPGTGAIGSVFPDEGVLLVQFPLVGCGAVKALGLVP